MSWIQSISVPDVGDVPVDATHRSPNHSHLDVRSPHIIVIHATAGGSAYSSVQWLCQTEHRPRASAHFVMPRDPDVIYQLVSLDRAAWHAGKSHWAGQDHVSRRSWGIELANWQQVYPDGDRYRTWAGAHVAADAVCEAGGGYWEIYPREQILAAGALTAALIGRMRSLGEIVEVVGHEHISPGRKTDPGPAFPWEAFAEAIEAAGVKTGPYHGVYIYPLHGKKRD